MIIYRLREANFQQSSLAELGDDARSFAGDHEDCCVGGMWHGRAVSGGRVALGSSRCYNNYTRTGIRDNGSRQTQGERAVVQASFPADMPPFVRIVPNAVHCGDSFMTYSSRVSHGCKTVQCGGAVRCLSLS